MSDNSSTKRVDVVAGDEVVLEDIEEPTKVKTSNNKKKVIAVICSVLILLIIGIVLIITKDKPIVDDEGNEIIDEKNLLVKIGDTYEGLNYTSTKEKLLDIGFYYNYSINAEGSKIDVSCIKIDGFKNLELQEKVNNTLEEKALSLTEDSYIQDPKVLYNHVYNVTDVYIFNNVLSTMYCKEFCDVEGNISKEYSAININLKDYKEYKLEDVFIKGTDINSILSNVGATNSDEMVFSVSPKNLYIVSSNKVKKINLYENKDTVAIYNRFKENEKLFNKTYNASPYCFTTKKFYETDLYGIEKNNIFIDTCNMLMDKDIPVEVLDVTEKIYKEAVDRARSLGYNNPSKRYLIQIIPSVEKAEKIYDCKVKYIVYEVKKDFFTDRIAEFVIATENKEDEEISIPDYFNNTVLNGAGNLLSMDSQIFEKKVDEKGKEVSNNKPNNAMGIS